MGIKVELNGGVDFSSGLIFRPADDDIASSFAKDSYDAAFNESKTCTGIFCLQNLFPLLGLFASGKPPASNIEEMTLLELEERAILLVSRASPFKGVNYDFNSALQLESQPPEKGIESLESSAGNMVELLRVDAEIIYRFFIEASANSDKYKETDGLGRVASYVESIVRLFGSAAKNITFLFNLEISSGVSPAVSWANVLSFNGAVVELMLFVSEFSGGRGTFSLLQGAIKNVIAVLENIPDVRRLGALESLLISYQKYLPQDFVKEMLVLTANRKLEVCKDAMLRFIEAELRKNGCDSETIENLLSLEKDNFRVVKTQHSKTPHYPIFYNAGTVLAPKFIFFSEALMKKIELEPFYAQLIAGREPMFTALPLLDAPVFQISLLQNRDPESLHQILERGFQERGDAFMESLKKLRERLKEIESKLVRRVEGK